MSLYVEHVDYSPLQRALGQRRNARLTLLGQESRKTSDILAIAEAGINIANEIYGVAKQKELARAKLATQEYDQKIKQAARDAILNNEYTWEEVTAGTNTEGGMGEELGIGAPTGKKTPKMPESFDELYRLASEQIDKDFKGFQEIQTWARDQLYTSYDNAKGVALETILQQDLKSLEVLEKTIITNALNQDIASGQFRNTPAAINSSSSLTPSGKQEALVSAEKSFQFGTKDRQVKATTAAQGYDVAIKAIDDWTAAGELTAEESEILKKNAATVSQQTAAAVQQQSETIFQKAIESGQPLEGSLEQAVAGVPAPYRADTETLIRSQYQAKINQEDTEADAEMKQAWAKNEKRPDIVLKTLLTGKDKDGRGYADRMTTNTYAWWHDRFAGGREKDNLPQEVQKTLDGIIRDNVTYPTNESKTDAINRICKQRNPDGTFVVDMKSYNSYLELAGDKKVLDSFVNDGLTRLETYWGKRYSDAKTDSDRQAAQRALFETKNSYIHWLNEGQRSEDLSNAYVLSLQSDKWMKTEPPKLGIYEDEAAITRLRTKLDKRRAEIAGSTYPGQAPLTGKALVDVNEEVAIKAADETILSKDYGVEIVGSNKLDTNLYEFRVRGINPDRPEDNYWVTFTDNGKGNEQLWIKEVHSDGSFVWKKADVIKTVREKERIAREEAAKSAAAEDVRIREAAAVQKPSTAKEIVDFAAKAKTGTALQSVAEVAAGGEEEPGAVQIDQITAAFESLGRKGTLTVADIEKIASDTGISEVVVTRMAADRGWKISK